MGFLQKDRFIYAFSRCSKGSLIPMSKDSNVAQHFFFFFFCYSDSECGDSNIAQHTFFVAMRGLSLQRMAIGFWVTNKSCSSEWQLVAPKFFFWDGGNLAAARQWFFVARSCCSFFTGPSHYIETSSRCSQLLLPLPLTFGLYLCSGLAPSFSLQRMGISLQ